MNKSPVITPSCSFGPSIPAHGKEIRWYAAYTRAQHEKSVACQLELRAIESFLPVYEKMSRWKDRRIKVRLPLFSGYVFVRMTLEEKLRVLQVPGVVRLVGFGGLPVALPDKDIDALRMGVTSQLRVEPHPYLTVGRRVRLKSGPLAGLQGIMQRQKANYRVVISVELIQRSIIVDAHMADLDLI